MLLGGKFLFIFSSVGLALAAIYLGYHFNTIYVSANFEKPIIFKLVATFMRNVRYFSDLLSWVNGVEPAVNFRHCLNFLTYLSDSYKKSDAIEIKEEIFNGNMIRIFRPKLKADELTPALIYFHGGGYVMGSIDLYPHILDHLASSLSMTVFSVSYRLAPEHPFPTPVDDCWNVTNHIIDNHLSYEIDSARIALVGDSAGGNAVAVISQRFAKLNKPYPKLQAFIYPWLQAFNLKLPSLIQFESLIHSLSRFLSLYFGFQGSPDLYEMSELLRNNQHVLALEDEDLIRKYDSYLNVSLIPDEYKINKASYEVYEQLRSANQIYPHPDERKRFGDEHFFSKNKQRIRQMFSTDMSPVLADDDLLKKLPKAYFNVLEWDLLRDEALIYAFRLKQNGVDVQIDFFEDAFHGMITFVPPKLVFQKALEMRDNLLEFLKHNL